MTSKEQFEKNVISTLAENGCSENQAMAILKETMEHLGEYLESALKESYTKGVEDAINDVKSWRIKWGDGQVERFRDDIVKSLEQLKEK